MLLEYSQNTHEGPTRFKPKRTGSEHGSRGLPLTQTLIAGHTAQLTMAPDILRLYTELLSQLTALRWVRVTVLL